MTTSLCQRKVELKRLSIFLSINSYIHRTIKTLGFEPKTSYFVK